MYYLYNSKMMLYIGKSKNRFYATRDFKKAYNFENEFVASNVLLNGNLPKGLPGREEYIVKHQEGDCLLKPYVPTEEEINKKNKFSFDKLEKEIKLNERKIKTANTYLKNVYESTKNMEKTLFLLENKIVLIYHYIESGNYTEEEKHRIIDLLSKTLTLRREVKKQRAVFATMENSPVLKDMNRLVEKLVPFKYWDYKGLENFIKIIEEGEDVVK